MPYLFDTQLVLDGDSPTTVVTGTSITIYDPLDTSLASPLTLTDTRGLPMANPIPVNPQGFVPAFQAAVPQIMWSGGGFNGYMSSFNGVLAATQAAQLAATGATSKSHYAVQNPSTGVIPPRPTSDPSVLVFWICWTAPPRVTSGTGGALPNDIWIQRASPFASPPSTPPPPSSGGPLGVGGTWTLVLDEQWSTLNTDLWTPYWFTEGGQMNDAGMYSSNVSVSNGELQLKLPNSTSAGMVTTDPHNGAPNHTGFEFTTGYAEARIFFPGDGTHAGTYNFPAWWTAGQPLWPANNEFDIAEGKGAMYANYINAASVWRTNAIPGVWNNGWHVFGLHRKQFSADVYYDGVKVATFTTDDATTRPHFLILNTGSGALRGYPQLYGTGATVRVDYVKFWSGG